MVKIFLKNFFLTFPISILFSHNILIFKNIMILRNRVYSFKSSDSSNLP